MLTTWKVVHTQPRILIVLGILYLSALSWHLHTLPSQRLLELKSFPGGDYKVGSCGNEAGSSALEIYSGTRSELTSALSTTKAQNR